MLEAHCTELEGRAWVVELRQQTATPLFSAVFQAEPASATREYLFSTGFVKEPLARPFQSVSAIDMDGDQHPELFIRAGQQLASGERQSAGTLLRAEHDAIREYLPAHDYTIDDVQDFDADGRPDLLLGFVLRGDPAIKRCAPRQQSWGTLVFLGHTLPDGGLSLTDEVAVRYARQQCPTRPEPPYYRKGQSLADVTHAYYCARLWQIDSDTLKKSFQDACRSQTRQMARCEGACGALQGHIPHLAEFQPPLSL
ncbi:VCBS repeat-containing protein [Archangium lipolyticum]|uniref:VCBS repeat-containing protein n=1 Tax=Archangium lipolyticum TaxID=2970465 RepID=UPI002149B22E|nr:VCBS repeat-containing protein [Archangium lipolyticum]